MKNGLWWSLAAFVGAVVVIGCGGGGGGTGGGGGNNGGSTGDAPYQGQYLEFTGISRGGNLDPLSLQVGDTVQVEVANYDPAGNRTVLPATNWTCTAGSANVSINSVGRLIVLRQTPGIFSVSARVTVSGAAKTIQQDSAVPTPSTTTFSGRVLKEATNEGIKYVQVNFYDGSGAAVAGARTGDDGIYKAQVPTSVKSVSIKSATVAAPPYYRSFYYGGLVYTMDASACPLKLKNIKTGQNNALTPMSIFLQENGPPPPPDGCKP